jgi:glycine cleavage system H lipoate-binding protein
MLINTKDGLPQGVDEEKNTLSVFSVSNYANCTGKAGILKINKNLSLVPYLLNNSPTKKGSWVPEIQTKSNLSFTSAEL